jgi:hypothetical protein
MAWVTTGSTREPACGPTIPIWRQMGSFLNRPHSGGIVNGSDRDSIGEEAVEDGYCTLSQSTDTTGALAEGYEPTGRDRGLQACAGSDPRYLLVRHHTLTVANRSIYPWRAVPLQGYFYTQPLDPGFERTIF